MKFRCPEIMRFSIALTATLLLPACGGGGAHNAGTGATVAPAAIIPPGSKMHDLPLALSQWKLTKGFRRIGGVSAGTAGVAYVGTGLTVGSEAATLIVPVVAGKIYVFSAIVDPLKIAKGEFDLIVDSADGRSSYSSFFQGVGAKKRYSTPPWLCPPGVTHVLLGMQIVGTAVTKGATLAFTSPVFSDVVPPAYSP